MPRNNCPFAVIEIGSGGAPIMNGRPLPILPINAPTGALATGYLLDATLAAGFPSGPEFAAVDTLMLPDAFSRICWPLRTLMFVGVQGWLPATLTVPAACPAGGAAAAVPAGADEFTGWRRIWATSFDLKSR